MKLFIPTIGTRLILNKPWTFRLHDEYRNEKFWLALHGTPVRTPYYSGWSQEDRCYKRSSTPTEICDKLCYDKAKPVATTLPKGTPIFVERIYIRKGLRNFDSVSFRIIKEINAHAPPGRFWAKMEDVNDNMDVVVIPATAKWPDGRFTLQTYSGTSYDCAVCNQWHNNCRCANGPVRPDYRSDHIRWINDPEARSYNFYVNVEHKTDTSGKDDIITKSHGGGNHGYVKHVDNLNACLTWAAKKEFTQAHIEAFVALYNQKKTEWEAKKEADTEA